MSPVNLHEFEALAKAKLSRMAYDYYASGAQDEITLRENRTAYDRIRLAYRVLVDVSHVDLRSTVLGQPLAMPVLAAPMAFQQLAHERGEREMARAVGKAGSIMVLSTLSNAPVEEVVAEAMGPVWFQLYLYKDRGASAALVERAERAGCRALVLTVDAPVLGKRERDLRNRFHLPDGFSAENMLPAGYEKLARPPKGSGLAAYFASLLDPNLQWRDLEWLRCQTSMPLILKGIVRADDALRAADHGVAGIVVSNHGGRQLDTALPTIEALPAIAEALAERASKERPTLLVDGGIRRGTDIVKALALGADAVLLGRPLLWGLATAAAKGVATVFEILREELASAMALCGCRNLGEITADLIHRAPSARS